MYIKTRQLAIPVSPEVAGFAACLESYLATRGLDLVESWEGISVSELILQLQGKLAELKLHKIDQANPRALFEHAIAMGCFAMMISEQVARNSKILDQLGSESVRISLLPPPSDGHLKA